MEKTKAIIIRANHFDPVWRRCWDRPFYDGGRRFASYREIEGYFFDDALESGEAFSCESAWTIRKYLEKHPERLEEVKRLHGEGKFELLGAGENIIDTNMPGTECLIRNLVIGLLWGRDTFGETPSIPCFTDVFGSSCQLPQLVRGCGMASSAAAGPAVRAKSVSSSSSSVKRRFGIKMSPLCCGWVYCSTGGAGV